MKKAPLVAAAERASSLPAEVAHSAIAHLNSVRDACAHFRRIKKALDPGIRHAVRVLMEHCVDTHQSCEGGRAHSYEWPTVDFSGGPAEGFRAYAIALENDLKPTSLLRVWDAADSELDGPFWRMEFSPPPGWKGRK